MALSKESFLPDQAGCAETWREVRWPDGARCPECGSEEVQTRQRDYRDGLHRYHCETCDKWFIDTTGTFLEASNVFGSLQREPEALGVLRARVGQGPGGWAGW